MKSFYKISLAIVTLILISTSSSFAERAVDFSKWGEYCGNSLTPRTCGTGLTCSSTTTTCVAVNPYAVEITRAERTVLNTFMNYKVKRVWWEWAWQYGGTKTQKKYIFLLADLIGKLNDYKAYYQSPLHMNTRKVSMANYLIYEMSQIKVSMGSTPDAGTTLPDLPFCAAPSWYCPVGRICDMMMLTPQTYTNYTDWETENADYMYTGACENYSIPA